MTVKLNSKNKCLVCFKEGNLVEHYVSFDAKTICYVHNECHKKIHDIDNPITNLIQYEEGDSVQFYKQQKMLKI